MKFPEATKLDRMSGGPPLNLSFDVARYGHVLRLPSRQEEIKTVAKRRRAKAVGFS